MQKRTKTAQLLLAAGCTGMIFASTGCRSAMPRMNMFSWRGTPSAEKLAGSGPTTTYPAPPGESATPDAIASIAGGTGSVAPSASVAGIPKDPTAPMTGFDAKVAPVNPAAAQANGFNLASTRVPGSAAPSSTTPGGTPNYIASNPNASTLGASSDNASVPAIPTGYQFGTRSTPPVTPAGAATPSDGSRYAVPSSYPAPGAPPPSTKPSSGYTLPGGPMAPSGSPSGGATNSSFSLPTEASATQGSGAAGLALPDAMMKNVRTASNNATNPKPFMPKAADSATKQAAAAVPNAGLKLPGDPSAATPAATVSTGPTSPSFSTASASLSNRVEAGVSSPASGYAPGSTSNAGAYPTTSGYPSTGTEGSFYR